MAEDLNAQNDMAPHFLHGAKFEDGGDPVEAKITELLDQIGEGLKEDDATNFQKLEIARKYGPLVSELKSMTPHGMYMKRLKERFPKPSYDKCHRWRYLAENEDRVAAALAKFPDTAWGPKKMTDFLRGCWSPEAEDEEDRFDGDEDEYRGVVPTEFFQPVEHQPEADESDDEDKEIVEDPGILPFNSTPTPQNANVASHRSRKSSKSVSQVTAAPDHTPPPPFSNKLVDELPFMASILTRVSELMDYLDWSVEDNLQWQSGVKDVADALTLISKKLEPTKRVRGRPPKKS